MLLSEISYQLQRPQIANAILPVLMNQLRNAPKNDDTCSLIKAVFRSLKNVSVEMILDVVMYVMKMYVEIDFDNKNLLLQSIIDGIIELCNALNDVNILQTILKLVMKSVTEKAYIVQRHGMQRIKQSVVEICVLLAPLSLLSRLIPATIRSDLKRSYEEIWYILIYFGYRYSHRWPQEYRNNIKEFALMTPVLTDNHLLEPGVLTKPPFFAPLEAQDTTTMRLCLTTIIPDIFALRDYSYYQMGYILTIYEVERAKVMQGCFQDIFCYLKDECILGVGMGTVMEKLADSIFSEYILIVKSKTEAKKRANEIHGLALRFAHLIPNRSHCISSLSAKFLLKLAVTFQQLYWKFDLMEYLFRCFHFVCLKLDCDVDDTLPSFGLPNLILEEFPRNLEQIKNIHQNLIDIVNSFLERSKTISSWKYQSLLAKLNSSFFRQQFSRYPNYFRDTFGYVVMNESSDWLTPSTDVTSSHTCSTHDLTSDVWCSDIIQTLLRLDVESLCESVKSWRIILSLHTAKHGVFLYAFTEFWNQLKSTKTGIFDATYK